jgi:threonine dehydratase
MLTIETIKAARERISSRIHRTPVITSRLFNEVAGKQVFFKCENLQRAGAFKFGELQTGFNHSRPKKSSAASSRFPRAIMRRRLRWQVVRLVFEL